MIESKKNSIRKKLSAAELEKHRDKGTIITDDRRRRPLWFDGRFLDADTLTSEQNYFITRQADIARVAGVGIIEGLMVKQDQDQTSSRTIIISAGRGITSAGKLIVLPEDFKVDLADVSENQQLDASFGLAELPRQSMTNRSGLFIVALRPVEFMAEPIASYPTSIHGSRSSEEGSIIEATAVTLIPYPDKGARTELNQRRKYVAREIFIEGSKKGQPTEVLPLAMIALDQGIMKWIDPYLVRREVGAAEHDIFGIGMSPRVLREAFLLQYHHHLTNILAEQQNGNERFAASKHFLALPSAGPMPAAAIDPDDFTQSYFPAEMNVELSVVPEDEITSLLEESFSLPSLDLTLSGDEYESTSVLVMIPVRRHEVRDLSLNLKSLIHPLKATTPWLVSKRKPINVLADISARRTLRPNRSIDDPVDKVWREVLASTDTLWYSRRRNISYKAEIVGVPVPVIKDEAENEVEVENRMKEMKIATKLKAIKDKGTSASNAEVISFLGTRTFLRGPKMLVKAAVNEINSIDKVNRKSVLKVSKRYSATGFGEGVKRLEVIDDKFKKNDDIIDIVTSSGRIPELDRLAGLLSETKLKVLSKEIIKVAETAEDSAKTRATKVAKLVEDRINELKMPKRVKRVFGQKRKY